MIRPTVLLLTLATGAAIAQPKPPAKPTPGKKAEAKKDDKKKKEKEKPDRWFAVHAGWAHTVSGATLRDVTILSKNGKIVEIGAELELPEKTEEVDARAYHVYPGIVAYESYGLVGGDPANSTDVYGLNLVLALSTGITTVGAGGNVAKLTYGTLEGHVIGRRTPQLRIDYRYAASRRKLRADLEKARAFKRELREAMRKKKVDPKLKLPTPKGKTKQLLELMEGRGYAQARANSTRELTDLANLALQYGFRCTIIGGTEAWTCAALLGRAGFRVVASPRGGRRSADPRTNRPTGWTIENAAKLRAHGVPVIIVPAQSGIGTWGLAGQDLLTVTLEAAFAVRGGLSNEEALRAITLGPAQFLGVDDRVGSIEVGKDCDLIIARGDLLHYEVLPEWTIVNARVAYDKQKDSLLRHIRPRDITPKTLRIPQLWPRKVGEPEPEMPEAERR